MASEAAAAAPQLPRAVPYLLEPGASVPRIPAQPASKSDLRAALDDFAAEHYGAGVVDPKFVARDCARFSHRLVSIDGEERLFLRTKNTSAVSRAVLPGATGVPGAAVVGSLLAPATAVPGSGPVVAVISFDIWHQVPPAKNVAHVYRASATAAAERRRPTPALPAQLVARALVQEHVALSQLPQAIRADPIARFDVLGYVARAIHECVTYRPGRLPAGSLVLISGHGGGFDPFASPAEPLVFVAGGAPELPPAFARLALPRRLVENAWSCTSFAHRLGEADAQHFYFASTLSLDESGLRPDVCWIASVDGDAAYNAVLYLLVRRYFLPELPHVAMRVLVSASGGRKRYCEDVSAVAEALAERYRTQDLALSYMLALAASGNDYVPSLLRRRPKAFAAAFECPPRALVTFEPFDPTALLREWGGTDAGRGLRSRLVREGRRTWREVLVTFCGGYTCAVARFDLDAITTFYTRLATAKVPVDYIAQRTNILVAYFAHALQIGRPEVQDLCVPGDENCRLGFARGADRKLLWDFRQVVAN
jgi:hypothetical protein